MHSCTFWGALGHLQFWLTIYHCKVCPWSFWLDYSPEQLRELRKKTLSNFNFIQKGHRGWCSEHRPSVSSSIKTSHSPGTCLPITKLYQALVSRASIRVLLPTCSKRDIWNSGRKMNADQSDFRWPQCSGYLLLQNKPLQFCDLKQFIIAPPILWSWLSLNHEFSLRFSLWLWSDMNSSCIHLKVQMCYLSKRFILMKSRWCSLWASSLAGTEGLQMALLCAWLITSL